MHALRPRDSLDLPPAYTLVTLREGGDAFAHACAVAAEAGAGTLVWTRRFDLVEFAVVLEPEEPLSAARCALFVGLTAMADAIGAHCPPEKAVTFDWPVTLRFDGARVGGARLAWPEGAAEDAPPAWLVFGGMIQTDGLDPEAPGRTPDATSLAEEGFTEVEAGALVESFARHLMVHFDAWHERGFRPLGRLYLERLARDASGGRHGIDVNGDLLVQDAGGTRRIPLLPALASPAWYDPDTRMPRL